MEKLQQAIELGLCDENYTWLQSKALCAYFSKCLAYELELFTGMQGNEYKVNWQPFETLFGMSNFNWTMNDYKKRQSKPGGSKIVDSIF